MDITNATFAEVPSTNSIVFEGILQYAANHTDAPEQLFSNPGDAWEPERDVEVAVSSDSEGDMFGDSTTTLSRSKPRVPRFELGGGVCKVRFDSKDSQQAVDIWVMHYVLPEHPLRSYGDRTMLYRACAIGVEGRGKSQKAIITEFTAHAVRWKALLDEERAGEGRYVLFRCQTNRDCERVWWKNEGIKIGRPLEKVYVPPADKEELVKDMRHFLSPKIKKWYNTHGLPYRRSYMLYGPPGTGKTTMIRSLCGVFRLNACFLNVTNRLFSNQTLQDCLGKLPGNSCLVLEDFDSLFIDRKGDDSGELTFSGLLNALDGLLTRDGVVTFMTTNTLERMDRQDPALLRAGRVDRVFKFSPPGPSELKQMLVSFLPEATEEEQALFADAVSERSESDARSIATLQELFIYCQMNKTESDVTAADVIASLDNFFKVFFPHHKQSASIYS